MTRLEILDVGSNKGKALKANAEQALLDLGLDLVIEEVSDINQLLGYGISGIPAMAIDGRVVLQKTVPSVQEMRVVLGILLSSAEGNALSLRSIVAPTDFSEVSHNALAYAKSIAAVQQAGIHIVHVHQAPTISVNPYLTHPSSEELHFKEAQLSGFLSQPVYTNGFDAGRVPMHGELIVGPVIEELKRLSRQSDTDMIVMGTTGDSGLLHRLFGSISSEVARRAYCPVILVPGGVRFRGFRRIVYAGNYERQEAQVLTGLMRFARRFQSDVQYVHINAHPDLTYRVEKTIVGTEANSNGAVSGIVNIECQHIIEGLNRYAHEQEADLIVMSTAHRNFLEALFHNSVTRQAALHTQLPLMIIHPDDHSVPAGSANQ
jgi:nucleotide-binding universal stress UspA family protein